MPFYMEKPLDFFMFLSLNVLIFTFLTLICSNVHTNEIMNVFRKRYQ